MTYEEQEGVKETTTTLSSSPPVQPAKDTENPSNNSAAADENTSPPQKKNETKSSSPANDAVTATTTPNSNSDDVVGGDSPDDLLPSNLHDPPIYGTVSFWAEFTSIHGVYYMFERGHLTKWKQILWSILCVVCLGGLLWALQAEIRDFQQFKNNSEHKTVIPQSLAFPQVTLCNTNSWDVSRQNATGIMEPANEAQVNLISQPLEEFIMDTSFNGVKFDNNDDLALIWTPVITPLGRCYTFITDERIFVSGPSSAGGLNVRAWLNQSNYQETTAVAGVSVYVTQVGSTVTTQTPSVLVPPGSASFVSVNLFQFQREEREPWRNCNGYTPEYSNELCRNNCFQTVTRQQCNCRLLGDDTRTTTTNSTNGTVTPPLRYCNSTDQACQQGILGNSENQLENQCQHCSIPPCREEFYTTAYSSAKIAVKAASTIEALKGLDAGEIAQNYVSMDINYDSIRYEERTESRSTSFSQMLSNLGGSMGFFMGISMISIVELFGELMILRLLPRMWGDRRLYGLGQKED